METYNGFKVSELKEVFDAIRNQKDWKAEINAWCYGEEVSAITAAIQYFTCTTPEFHLHIPPTGALRYVYHADGYRKGPAGDH